MCFTLFAETTFVINGCYSSFHQTIFSHPPSSFLPHFSGPPASLLYNELCSSNDYFRHPLTLSTSLCVFSDLLIAVAVFSLCQLSLQCIQLPLQVHVLLFQTSHVLVECSPVASTECQQLVTLLPLTFNLINNNHTDTVTLRPQTLRDVVKFSSQGQGQGQISTLLFDLQNHLDTLPFQVANVSTFL